MNGATFLTMNRSLPASDPAKQTPKTAYKFPSTTQPSADLCILVRLAGRDEVPSSQRHRAFAQIVARFQDFAFGMALGVLGDRALAEDVAQEAFVVAWQSLASLRQPEAFPGWFAQIVRSRCHRVTRGYRATVSYESLGESVPLIADKMLDPHRQVEQSERQAVVWAALTALPAHQRTATVLYYLGDMDQGTIADVLGVPVTTIKKRIWAARKTLRERMHEYMTDFDTTTAVQETVQADAPSRGTRFQNTVALWTACDDGDAAQLQTLLAASPEGVLVTDSRGNTLLHRAAECGYTEVVRVLLAHGAPADARTATGATPLHTLAMGSCRIEIADLLCKAGAPISAVDDGGLTALETAALSAVPAGETDSDGFALAEFLLTQGGVMTLSSAAALDQPEAVPALAGNNKALLTKRDAVGDTPLHTACRAGYRRIAKALLDAGAPIEHLNADGHTALEVALQPGRKRKLPFQQHVVDLLRARKATVTLRAAALLNDVSTITSRLSAEPQSVHTTDASGATALHTAAWMGKREAVTALLAHGANPNAKDNAGRSPLSVRYSAADVDAAIAATLVEAGAQLDIKTALALGRADWLDRLMPKQSPQALAELAAWAIDAGCPPQAIGRLLVSDVVLDGSLAAALDDTPRLKALIAEDKNLVRSRDAERNTPLHRAAMHGQREAVQLLIAAGANRDAIAGDGATPLFKAIAGGHADVAEMLLSHGAQPDLASHRGDAPLHAASAVGYTDLVAQLIERGADSNGAGANQDTPLHRGAQAGHTEIVRLLLARGAAPNRVNFWGGTALHVAAREGHVAVVEALLNGKADLLARDRWYRTPLHVAAYFDHPDVALRLLDAGIAVTELSYGFSTPLHTAADRGSVAVARLLVEHGADVNAPTDFGRTPLHDAVQHGQTEMVQFLLDAGANAAHPNNRGMTPLHWAAAGGHVEIARLLRDAGADGQAVSYKGETARDLALRYNQDDIAALLT